ncbi:MAG: NAD(P)/FAD-dependent oxidoreductase, partial [Actinobacteria bacterium]|nr:NAD(P)/FAD-dependent oxidoreductase [Actinomycetota bacterium]
MADPSYDVVVIGAGPVGENVADRAHRGGLRACVVERRLAGGECSYFACIPSKAMLRPVLAADGTRRLGKALRPAEVDPAGVLERRDQQAGRDDSGQAQWLSDAGIDLVRGQARLDGERRVIVTDGGSETVLEARHAVVLAVGTDPALSPIPGLAGARPWTNREATTASQVPKRLAVLGGGPVGCELAQAYAGLGTEVTLIVRGERLLARFEPFAGGLVADGLREAGVDLRLGSQAARVTRDGGSGPVTVDLADGTTVEADEILAALGRQPATTGIG